MTTYLLATPLGATWAELSLEAATAVEQLPMIHRDPFDRLIAAQALVGDSTLITADERLLAYPVATLDARL